ncbi:hypothetical protein P43SY_006074 [Pythium insidiosum]|uniref:Alpha-ketoglutarate-dependent dioxygenase AlkB-like domain-containing protein n=1 Tax=Pythium insidiosum TaxID=114742 RepID=A0AAD5LFG5_PYTIN|nr:hypothetical protein P43SY_006074 [Pythium insidiosum]
MCTATSFDEDKYLELKQLKDIKSEEFYDEQGVHRRYFYYVDLQGRLFLENTRPKNIASSLKSSKFLRFFFSQLRPNRLEDPSSPSASEVEGIVPFMEYPFRSPCGKEMNFIKCADRPIVFEDLRRDPKSEQWRLVFGGGELSIPFEPDALQISESTGRLYHRFTNKHFGVGDVESIGLVRSQVAVELGKSIQLYDDDHPSATSNRDMPVGEFEWESKRYPISSPVVRDEFAVSSLLQQARRSAAALANMSEQAVDHLLRDARVIYLTDDHSSWIYHAPRWYKRIYAHCVTENTLQVPYVDWFHRVWDLHPAHHDTIKMFGRDVPTPRFQQAYGQSYKFSGSMFHAKPFPAALQHALALLQAFVTHPSTHETYLKAAGLVNWYANGDHYMGPHSDDESNIYAQSPVFSLSLGATRRFVFTPRASKMYPLAPEDTQARAPEDEELRWAPRQFDIAVF